MRTTDHCHLFSGDISRISPSNSALRTLRVCPLRSANNANANTERFFFVKEAPARLCLSINVVSECDTSVWLSALPIESHGFWLHKGNSRDSLSLRYGWPLQHLASKCVCDETLSVDHALSCPLRGFPILCCPHRGIPILWHNKYFILCI